MPSFFKNLQNSIEKLNQIDQGHQCTNSATPECFGHTSKDIESHVFDEINSKKFF